MTTVERVLRAVWDACQKSPTVTFAAVGLSWDTILAEIYATAITEASAAIIAMRGVDAGTPKILLAGKKALFSCSEDAAFSEQGKP